MNPNLWKAVDRIGSRKTSRFEWQTQSGVPWGELSPYLSPVGGVAREVPDPDDLSEYLVVHQNADGTAFLESQHFPAHRKPIRVDHLELRFYGLNLHAIAQALAPTNDFTPRFKHSKGPLFDLGFVQKPGAIVTPVFLFVPSIDPRQDMGVLAHVKSENLILLVPATRWTGLLPLGVNYRDLASQSGHDHLINVALSDKKRKAKMVAGRLPIINVRNEDRWENVKIAFDMDSNRMVVTIGKRHGDIQLVGGGARYGKSAEILMRILSAAPPVWNNAVFPEKARGAYRKAFQRFVDQLKDWIPVNDGLPFEENTEEHTHVPRFKFVPLKPKNPRHR